MVRFASYIKAGVAQLAEHQPSKLRVAGSIPVSRSIVSPFRLPGPMARVCSVWLLQARIASERRCFPAPPKTGVLLGSSTELRQNPHAAALALPNGSLMIWLINSPIYLASLSYSISRFFSSFLAHVAQSVEHFLGKEEVIGSNPIVGSKKEIHFIIFPKDKEGWSHVEAEV